MPARLRRSMARHSESRSPGGDGMSTGMASCSLATIERVSVRLRRNPRRPRSPRSSSSRSAESTLTLSPPTFQRADGIFEMRKRRVRQAAEVDHVGTGSLQSLRALR